MIVDTDVLIWYLRGNKKAAAALDRQPFKLSAVTYMQVVQGMRNRAELRTFRGALTQWRTPTIFVDESICSRAMAYVEAHFHNAGLRLADALTAATAWSTGEELLTGNARHFSPLGDIVVRKFHP